MSGSCEVTLVARTRVFFITDVHGSDRCFKKFLNAGKFYGASVLILGGDITGKLVIPVVKQGDGTYEYSLGSDKFRVGSQSELELALQTIRDSGFYPYMTDPKEVEELSENAVMVKELFTRLMVEGVRRWIGLAEERLKGTEIRCYISPGNDDVFEIDKVLDSSSYVVNPEEKVVRIDEQHEMITLGTTNHTPWNSPREVDEEVLTKKIEAMATEVKDMKKAIFNIHVPPIDTVIDQAPKLDKTLKPIVAGGSVQMGSAGSIATRAAIEKYQPLIGLHGHIHESKGMVRIGRTICLNPGSDYGFGVLRGVQVELEDDKVKSYLFTSG
ncbi:MAG: metallophosphoesterase [Nitrososphaerota archaeon]|nr:metallophosphoesterase [Nitrososphaerota archaeon]